MIAKGTIVTDSETGELVATANQNIHPLDIASVRCFDWEPGKRPIAEALMDRRYIRRGSQRGLELHTNRGWVHP